MDFCHFSDGLILIGIDFDLFPCFLWNRPDFRFFLFSLFFCISDFFLKLRQYQFSAVTRKKQGISGNRFLLFFRWVNLDLISICLLVSCGIRFPVFPIFSVFPVLPIFSDSNSISSSAVTGKTRNIGNLKMGFCHFSDS